MNDRPSTTLDYWHDLKARTWDALIWWLMTRVLSPLLRLALRPFDLFQPSPSMPEHFNARSSVQPVHDVNRENISFVGIKLTAGELIKGGELVYIDDDGKARPLRPIGHHYRDEDGELRPTRFDRSGLADAMLGDLAANFLQAKEDAEASVDPYEQAFIAAVRDAYGAELHRRNLRGAEKVYVGGCNYLIVATAGGSVDLVSLDEIE